MSGCPLSFSNITTFTLNPNANSFFPRAIVQPPAPQLRLQGEIRVGFLNICSLRHKVAELEDLINLHMWDVIDLCETWLNSTISDNEIHIPGYCVVRCDRYGRQGGVCIFYKSTLPVSHRPDLQVDGLEGTWISVNRRGRQHLIGCMYRPPDSTVTYWERLDGALHKAALLTPSMTVLGDFNVDVGAGTTSPHYQRFSDLVASYGLRNLVTTATRTTPQCPNGKIIDLILTSCDDARSCAVVPSTLSDHDAVQVLLGLHVQVPRQACNSRKPFRNVRRIHIPDFRDDLDAAHLDTWPPNTTVDDMWSIWHYKLLGILDKHAPLQCSSAKRKQLPPWSDRHLFQLTQRKNRLHRRWRGDKANAALHTAFKRARAEARNAYRQKRNTYFQGQCTANAGNTKKLWRTINKVTCTAVETVPMLNPLVRSKMSPQPSTRWLLMTVDRKRCLLPWGLHPALPSPSSHTSVSVLLNGYSSKLIPRRQQAAMAYQGQSSNSALTSWRRLSLACSMPRCRADMCPRRSS